MQNILGWKQAFFRRGKKEGPQGEVVKDESPPAPAGDGWAEGWERPLVAPRDPLDQQLHFKLSSIAFTTSALLVLSMAGNFYQYAREPTVMMVKENGDVMVVGGREISTTTAATKRAREQTNAQAKKSATETFLELLYRVDPDKEVRLRDVARALKMLHPHSAARLSQLMDEKQIVTRQLAESQQSTWTVKDYSLDKRDPYLAHVVADQVLTRTLPGAPPETRTIQCLVKVKLKPDPDGRTSENANTGLQMIAYDFKTLPSGTGPQPATEGFNMTPASDDIRIEAPPAAAVQPDVTAGR